MFIIHHPDQILFIAERFRGIQMVFRNDVIYKQSFRTDSLFDYLISTNSCVDRSRLSKERQYSTAFQEAQPLVIPSHLCRFFNLFHCYDIVGMVQIHSRQSPDRDVFAGTGSEMPAI